MYRNFLTTRVMVAFLTVFIFAITAFSQVANEVSLKEKLAAVAGSIGIPVADIRKALVAKTFTDNTSGIEYIYLQQQYKGLPVYNQMVTVAFKNNRLVYTAGHFLPKQKQPSESVVPAVTAADAVAKAIGHLRLPAVKKIAPVLKNNSNARTLFFSADGIAKRDIEVELYWAADSLRNLHLAWNVNIDVANSADWWNIRVDASNGQVINKDNWTVYEKAPGSEKTGQNGAAGFGQTSNYLAPPPNDVAAASYYVIPYPSENVNINAFATVTDPWLAAGANNNATTYGWHYNGTTTYNITRGNNVFAYNDSANKNTPGTTVASSTPLPNLTFKSVPSFDQSASLAANRDAAIINLFYWNNIMHDVMYQYGFTEAAGNFQVSNLGRGGAGSDPVLAESQDGSGTNNANFSTPADGNSGRMQMYLWDAVNAPSLIVQTPANLAGSYNNVESGFSTANKLISKGPVFDTVVLYTADTLACSDTLAANVKGKIALIYRGTCNFTTKVKNAQKAGAVAVIMVNTKGSDLIIMGGTDNSITIPAVMISYDDGSKLSGAIKAGSTVTATLTGAPTLDGDFDNGIICHEYGHGISHRLTGGNASCLDNAEKADEGWSDYFALMMTQDWSKTTMADSAKSRTIGTYIAGEAPPGNGIRTYPYSTNMTINPHTYANVPRFDGEVHYIGEIWCATLWDMTWAIIKQENSIGANLYDANSTGGNVIALRLVMEGEKLQPCSPGFLDSRDAILAADSILYNGRHKCTIWNAFARRGMGISATQGSSFETNDQSAAFDVPVLLMQKQRLPIVSDQFTTKITLSCECQLPATGYQLTDTIPAGFTVASTDPAATIQGNIVTFDASTFTALGQLKEFSVTLLPDPNAGCTRDTTIYDNRDNHTTGGFVSSAVRGTTQWAGSSLRAYSPTKSWYAAETDAASDFSLVSAAFVPGNLSILSFRHYFSTEAGYDGGMIDISTNNGSNWTSAAPYFIQNGYNGVIYEYKPADTSYGTTPWPAFTGNLTDSAFIQSSIDLSSFAGKVVKLRFRMYNDLGTTYKGWYVDDITVTNGCGGLQGIGLISNAGKNMANAEVAIYNTDSTGVVQPAFADFTAVAVNNSSALISWSTISEANVASFVVERSTDSLTYTVLTTVAATGSGNDYTYTDTDPAGSVNYYRIRMVNAAGTTVKTSPVRPVAFSRSGGSILIVPNPAVSRATLLLDAGFSASQLVMFDMQGRRVYAAVIAPGITSFPINTSALGAGVYIVKVMSTTGEEKQVKLLVTR